MGRAWLFPLGTGLALALLFVALPYGPAAVALYVAATLLAAAGVWGATLYRRALFLPLAWTLVAGGLMLEALGHGSWYWLELNGLVPFPSLADLCFLAVYPLFMLALWRLGQPTGNNDNSALSDALIVGTSAAVLGWALLIAPHLRDPELTLGELLVSTAYPVADLLLLALLLRLVFLHRMRIAAHLLLLLGMLAYLTADVLYAHGIAAGWYAPGGVTDGLWLVAYALFAAAAWHPSAAIRPVSHATNAELSCRRLYLLGAASALVPAIILFTAGEHVEIVRVAAIASIALFLLVIYRMRGLLLETYRQAEVLGDLSRTDPLTGAANRRHLEEALAHELARAQRGGSSLSVALLDLDHFKAFNDTHGHAAGDALLQELVKGWQRELRHSDLLARYGGEEFVVIFPETDADQCRGALERLRRRVPFGQTCSAGFTLFHHEESAQQLLRRADAALYRAKRSGRNRVIYLGESPTGERNGTSQADIRPGASPR